MVHLYLDRLLRQPAYAGTLYYNRRTELPRRHTSPSSLPGPPPCTSERPQDEWIGVAVPPIVDLGTWERSRPCTSATARFSPRHVGAERYLAPLLGALRECGQARSVSRKDEPRTAPDAITAATALLAYAPEGEKLRCSQPSARADELDELVWAEVVRHLRTT